MKNYIKIIGSFLLVLAFLFCCSCTGSQTSTGPQTSTETNILNEIMTNEEQAQIRTLINEIHPEYKLYLSDVVYSDYKEESDQLATVGIKGIPVIFDELQKIEDDINNNYRCGFLYSCAFAVLRINPTFIRGMLQNEGTDIVSYYKKRHIVDFYNLACEKIPQIISSNEETDSKLKKLSDYGLLAAPYVMDEIEKGKSEYKDFFIQAGLHLSTAEFMELTSDGAAPLKERLSNAKYMKDAEVFDCNAWWDENKEVVENLNKFIKEY